MFLTGNDFIDALEAFLGFLAIGTMLLAWIKYDLLHEK